MQTFNDDISSKTESIHIISPVLTDLPTPDCDDNTIDIIKSKRIERSSMKAKNRSVCFEGGESGILEKTVEHTSKSASKDISPSKKDFHELLYQIENEAASHCQDLFVFQPEMDSSDKVSVPYLPKMSLDKKLKYTLVLDLDETLVHFEENEERTGGQFHVRPFAIDFLRQMANHFELVIFTAAIKEVRVFHL